MNGLSGGTTPTVFVNSKRGKGSAAHKLLQTTRLMLGAGFLLQTGRDPQAQICFVYIPALLAPACSTAALQQANTDWLFTSDLPHLCLTKQQQQPLFVLLSCCLTPTYIPDNTCNYPLQSYPVITSFCNNCVASSSKQDCQCIRGCHWWLFSNDRLSIWPSKCQKTVVKEANQSFSELAMCRWNQKAIITYEALPPL